MSPSCVDDVGLKEIQNFHPPFSCYEIACLSEMSKVQRQAAGAGSSCGPATAKRTRLRL